MRRRWSARAAAVTLAAGLLLAACTSPEQTRVRGESRGADVLNRRDPVEMHGGSDPYWRTPRAAPRAASAPDGTRPSDRVTRR